MCKPGQILYIDKQMKNAVLAIDIGGTNTKIGLVADAEVVGDVISIPSDGHINFDQYTDSLLEAVKKVKK